MPHNYSCGLKVMWSSEEHVSDSLYSYMYSMLYTVKESLLI